jgi:hypothetical protein
MLKNDGEDASRSSFPETAWNITGNFFEGKYEDFKKLLMTCGLPHGTRSPL